MPCIDTTCWQIRAVLVHMWKWFVGANILACVGTLLLNEAPGASVLAFVWLLTYCFGPAAVLGWKQWKTIGQKLWVFPRKHRWSLSGHVRRACGRGGGDGGSSGCSPRVVYPRFLPSQHHQPRKNGWQLVGWKPSARPWTSTQSSISAACTP